MYPKGVSFLPFNQQEYNKLQYFMIRFLRLMTIKEETGLNKSRMKEKKVTFIILHAV